MVTVSEVVFELLTSIPEPTKAPNKVALVTRRETFCPRLLFCMQWCPGSHRAADALTKDNSSAALDLLEVFRDGVYPCHPSEPARFPKDLSIFSS